MWKIVAPLKVPVSKKSYQMLNLNVYRNAHYQVLNKAKIAFKECILKDLQKLPTFDKCTINYVLYPETKRLCDVSNICTIVDKYFCDALVSEGKLKDDNYLYLPQVSYSIGSVDSENPRVEIFITPLNPIKEINTDMQIQVTLNSEEISTAIQQYIKTKFTYNTCVVSAPESMTAQVTLGNEPKTLQQTEVELVEEHKEDVFEESPETTNEAPSSEGTKSLFGSLQKFK